MPINHSFILKPRGQQYLDEHHDGDAHTDAYRRHLNTHIEERYGDFVLDFVIYRGYIKNICYLIFG